MTKKTKDRVVGFIAAGMVLVVLLAIIKFRSFNESMLTMVRASENMSTALHLRLIQASLNNFYVSCKRYPTQEEGLEVFLPNSEIPKDCWSEFSQKTKPEHLKNSDGHAFVYSPKSDNFELIDLGMDGKPGGDSDSTKDFVVTKEKFESNDYLKFRGLPL